MLYHTPLCDLSVVCDSTHNHDHMTTSFVVGPAHSHTQPTTVRA